MPQRGNIWHRNVPWATGDYWRTDIQTNTLFSSVLVDKLLYIILLCHGLPGSLDFFQDGLPFRFPYVTLW